MTCPHCHRQTCERTAVTIHGEIVCTWSETWRAECEARMVCTLPGLDRRRAYLAGVEKKRGKPAVEQLKDHIKQVWVASRSAQSPAGGGT